MSAAIHQIYDRAKIVDANDKTKNMKYYFYVQCSGIGSIRHYFKRNTFNPGILNL